MSSTAEWLDQCLHGRGSNPELPYEGDVKWTVRQHLLDLVAVSQLFGGTSIVHAVAASIVTETRLSRVPAIRSFRATLQLGIRSTKYVMLASLLQAFPTLTFKVQNYTHTNGR